MVEDNSQNGIPPLKEFFVYVTNYCNCSCVHCWIIPRPSSRVKRLPVALSPSVFVAAITEAKPLGLTSIKWTGGEPTIHPDFPKLLGLQRDWGLRGRLETNGMEVTASLARLFVDCRIEHVAVSIDGYTSETHDRIRGLRGAHQRALTGLRNLVDVGFRPQVIMSLMKSNIQELDGLLHLVRRAGAGSVKLNIIQPTVRGLEVHANGEALSVQEILELEQTLNREIQPSYPLPILLDVPMAFRSLKCIITRKHIGVCGVRRSLGLLPDGSYSLCGIGENVPELIFGRAGTGALQDIWKNHPVILQIRGNLAEKLRGICSCCLLKSLCRGSCLAQNYYRTKDITAGFWFCEVAAKQGLFPQTRRLRTSSMA